MSADGGSAVKAMRHSPSHSLRCASPLPEGAKGQKKGRVKTLPYRVIFISFSVAIFCPKGKGQKTPWVWSPVKSASKAGSFG